MFILSKSCRIREVSRKFMCRSSTKNRKMRPAASLVGRAGGQDDAFLRWRGRRGLQVESAAAVHQQHRRDLLFHAVFEDVELFLGQVGHELAVAVAHDDVGRHQVDERPERRTLGRRIGRRGRLSSRGLTRRGLRRERRGGQDQRGQQRRRATEQRSHGKSIARPDARCGLARPWFGRTAEGTGLRPYSLPGPSSASSSSAEASSAPGRLACQPRYPPPPGDGGRAAVAPPSTPAASTADDTVQFGQRSIDCGQTGRDVRLGHPAIGIDRGRLFSQGLDTSRVAAARGDSRQDLGVPGSQHGQPFGAQHALDYRRCGGMVLGQSRRRGRCVEDTDEAA